MRCEIFFLEKRREWIGKRCADLRVLFRGEGFDDEIRSLFSAHSPDTSSHQTKESEKREVSVEAAVNALTHLKKHNKDKKKRLTSAEFDT